MGRAGFVLVGGESSRMGRDKALLPLSGRTLVESVAESVTQAAGSVTLVGHPERYPHLPYPAISDIEAQSGPLAGLVSALRHSGAPWNLVVACDMPALHSDLLARLLDAAEARDDHDAVIPQNPEGGWEPLCAVYHQRCLSVLIEALEARRLKLRTALSPLRVTLLPFPAGDWFRNANTPLDWERHLASLTPPKRGASFA